MFDIILSLVISTVKYAIVFNVGPCDFVFHSHNYLCLHDLLVYVQYFNVYRLGMIESCIVRVVQ